jgi:hypothetical protein
MSAQITWWGSDGTNLNSLAGSGIGFYGAGGFGASVTIGDFNSRSFETDASGLLQGNELWNNKYLNPTGVILGQTGSGIPLNCIPNQQAVVNPRFVADSPVRVQNATFTFYDRVSTSNPPSGLVAVAYEVRHPGSGQTPDGSGGPGTPVISGNHAWWLWGTGTPTGAMPLSASPGTSGLSPSGSSTVDTRHDYYLSISTSPTTTGTKLFACSLYLEYL